MTLPRARALIEAASRATAAPWYSDAQDCDDALGTFKGYVLGAECLPQAHAVLADSFNSTAAEIYTDTDEGGPYRWDEIAERNFAFIALSRNDAPAIAEALLLAEQFAKDILAGYENQNVSHLDFRVTAAKLATEFLAKIDPTPPGAEQ